MIQGWRYTVFYEKYSERGEDSAYSNKEDALKRARVLHKMGKYVRVGVYDEKERQIVWKQER